MRIYSPKQLADLFFSMTGQVVDSNNINFLKSVIITPTNYNQFTSSINFRNLQIIVVKNFYGTSNMSITLRNLTGLLVNEENVLVNGSTIPGGVILGFSNLPGSCGAEIEIYTFK